MNLLLDKHVALWAGRRGATPSAIADPCCNN